MSDTTTLRARPAGWTIADGQSSPRRSSPRTAVATSFTLDAQDLAAATSSLGEHAVPGATIALRLSPAGLELTVRASDHTFWETAVLPVERTEGQVHAGADLDRFRELAATLAQDRATVEVSVTDAGRVRVEGVDLPAVDRIPEAPKRPSASGMVDHRIELPPTLPDGVPLRVPGIAVTLPSAVRRRFARRGVSMANLFEAEDGWYLSGIAQGRPMYALVGKVAVY